MKHIIPILLLLAVGQYSTKAMDQEQYELEQAIAASAEQYEREKAQQDIDEELELAKALSISGQEELERKRQKKIDAIRKTLVKVAPLNLQMQQAYEHTLELTGLPLKLQEQIIWQVLTNSQSLNELLQKLFNFTRSKQASSLLTNELLNRVKELIKQRNQQAELNSFFIDYSQKGNLDAVKLLLHLGADVNTRETYKQTALMLAAELGYKEIVQELLAAGANVEAINDVGATALMYAVSNGNEEIVKLLLAAGAHINAADRRQNTALIYAIHQGNTEIIRILLNAGADVNVANIHGKSVLNYVYESKNKEVIKLIQDAINKR